MSQDPFTGAISLRAPSALAAAQELGPLVRAQPVRVPEAWAVRLMAPFLGVAVPNLFRRPDVAAIELATVGTAFGVAWVIPRAISWWRHRRLRRYASWDGSDPPPSGPVRVAGRVRALGEPFVPPGETQPVVYCHTRFSQADPHGRFSYFHREDVRGLFLEIEVSGDTTVLVAPENIRLLTAAAVVPEVGPKVRWALGAPSVGWWQGKLRRRILRPGDQVEAVGEVVRQVSPQGAARAGRGVPMEHWLVPAWRGSVWIRRLRRR